MSENSLGLSVSRSVWKTAWAWRSAPRRHAFQRGDARHELLLAHLDRRPALGQPALQRVVEVARQLGLEVVDLALATRRTSS